VADLVDVPFAQVALDDAPEPGDDRQDVFLDRSHEDSENVEINGVALALTPDPAAATPMAGTFSMDGAVLRFHPRFAFAAGTSYAWITRQSPAGPTLLLDCPARSRTPRSATPSRPVAVSSSSPTRSSQTRPGRP
jgi:hypothetical protein